MADYEYWLKQGRKPIYAPLIDLERPEQRRMAGRLLIIGGSKGAFFAVAQAMQAAQEMGVGEVRALLPSSLRHQVPSSPEVYFAEAESSGAFGKSAYLEMVEHATWADAVVIIGDIGKNAETSVTLAKFLKDCPEVPIYMTRDAVDAAMPDVMNWAEIRVALTGLMLSISQLQKLLRTLYYPKVITLSMPTNQLIEILHKFTISYPDMPIVTYHNGQIIAAHNGQIVTTALSDTDWTLVTLFNGVLTVRMAILKMWNEQAPSIATCASAVNWK